MFLEEIEREEEKKTIEESTDVSIPTATPTVTPTEEPQKVFFGRRIIYSSLKKEELTAENILKILPSVLRIHEMNASEIDYLWRYYKGEQPILKKTKKVRPDINNVVLENHAFEIVEFKKSNDFGEPVQYVQKGEKDTEQINPELSLLNRYMESEDKSSLDNELSEWQCIAGTSYRWADTDTPEDEDEAPFEMSVPDPRRTFVVRSSGIKKEQLFSGYYSWFSDTTMADGLPEYSNKYRIITIYTDEFMLEIKESNGNYEVIPQTVTIGEQTEKVKQYPLYPKGQRIIEYPLNSARIGLIELVITQLNALNKIKSDDLDGIDQFVQSLLVFVNQDVDVEDVKELEEAGAIKVFTQEPNKPADVKLLTQQLLHSETKIVTDDIYNKILTILGIPRLNDKPSGGDTGQARLLGEGWTMAYQRAKQDDLNFKKSERQFLKLILKICKADTRNISDKIKDLKISDIDIKIPRDKSDNLLVKAQALLNLLEAGVHPEIAFTVVGLFGDPHDVYQKSLKFQGEDFWKKMKDIAENKLNNGSNNNVGTISSKQSETKNQNQNKNPASGVNN